MFKKEHSLPSKNAEGHERGKNTFPHAPDVMWIAKTTNSRRAEPDIKWRKCFTLLIKISS